MPETVKERESRLWRFIGWALGAALVICVVANLVRAGAIPHEITLILFGSLVALGVGGAVLNPRTSPVRLSAEDEARFRRRQYVIGFVVSTLLVLLLVLTELGASALAWLFAPIVVLPYALVIRALITKE